VSSPYAQAQYQVRFDWGITGAEDVATDADVIVMVDVLTFTTALDTELAAGRPVSAEGSLVASGLVGHPAQVVGACLRNRTAVASWVLDRQAEKGDRFRVAIIAAGSARAEGPVRFAVEDLLAAGAIVDALAEVGIDYCSPEAAVASAAFTTLRRATGHLISASGSGQELIAGAGRALVDTASDIDVSRIVPVLHGTTFTS
jgi:2-phosphosulfolactate phosphatase